VQRQLESRQGDRFIDRYMSSAALLAEEAPSLASTSLFLPRVAENIPVGQSYSQGEPSHGDIQRDLSIPEVDVSQPEVFTTSLNVLEVSSLSGSPLETSLDQASPLKTSVVQNTGKKGDSLEVSVTKISPTQIGVLESSVSELNSLKTGTFQVSVVERDIRHSGSSQIGSSQNDPVQFQIIQSATTPVHPREVSFSIDEKSLPQLFAVHDFSLQLGVSSYSTIQFLQASLESFDLNIEITDLPTGQLAEANITRFDPTGRPTSGTLTLTLDTDANGLGWFIDSTPWDNSEYAQSAGFANGTLNAETFFRATPGSAAYGHHDLLTTILHVRAAFALANTRPPLRPHQRHPHLRRQGSTDQQHPHIPRQQLQHRPDLRSEPPRRPHQADEPLPRPRHAKAPQHP
jgi:hypothetical protein